MGNIPFAPTQHYDYQRRGQSIRDLMLMSGEQQAAAAQRAGEIWGGFANQLGQIGAGAVQQYGAQQQQEKKAAELQARDKATLGLMSKYDGSNDEGLLQGMTTIWGPEEGLKMAEGIKAFKSKPAGDAKTELQGFATATDAFLRLSPEAQSAAWEPFKGRWGDAIDRTGLVPKDKQPAEWSPQVAETLTALRDSTFQVMGVKGAEAPKPPGTHVVGGNLVDDTGKVLFTAPEKETPAKTHVVGGNLVTDEGKVLFTAPKEGAKDEGVEFRDAGGVINVYDKSGKLVRQDPKTVPPGGGKVTGQERTALGFYNRAKQASEDIAPIEESIAKQGIIGQLQLQSAPNMLQSGEQQAYRQAQRAFTEARLRKESGAAIPNAEYEADAKTYFAQPGDSAQVMEQKRRGRQAVLQGLAISSGGAYEEFYGSPAPKGGTTPGRYKIVRKN